MVAVPPPGTAVTVDDGVSPIWVGRVRRHGLFPSEPLLVAVLDPGENRGVVRGQHHLVFPGQLSRVFRSRRWSR
jgi:hypothetical protein